MARPRETDKRNDLARRAARVLEEKGLAISTEQLARELGVNRTTLLYHFPSYADVFRTVLTELMIEQAAFVAKEVDACDHPIDRLYARIRAAHAFHRGRERRIVFLSQAVAVTAGPEVTEILRGLVELFDADRRALVVGLERGIAEGTVAPCDAKALVSLARALIDGVTIQSVTSAVDADAIHALFWEKVLLPLKRRAQSGVEKNGKKKQRKPS